MRNAFRILGMLLCGLFAAVIGYPFLHEAGHVTALLLSGGELYEFSIFPVPRVVCYMGRTGAFAQSLVGISGMLLPFAVSQLLVNRAFWGWLFSFYLRWISALAFALSCLAVLCFQSGTVWANEDIIKVLELPGQNSYLWLCVSLFLFCLDFVLIYRNRPIIKIQRYLGI